MKYPPINYFQYQYNNKLIEPLLGKNKLFIKQLYKFIWIIELLALAILSIPREKSIETL